MMTCSICNHPKRAEIEQACLLRNFGDTEITLKDIAKEYDVDLKDLQVHVLTHIPLESEACKDINTSESLAGKLKMREADILRNVMEESLVTFKNLSAKINAIVAAHTTEEPTLIQITKPVAELYLGTSQSIRDTANTLIKLNLAVNGEDSKGLSAIASLVDAIHGS